MIVVSTNDSVNSWEGASSVYTSKRCYSGSGCYLMSFKLQKIVLNFAYTIFWTQNELAPKLCRFDFLRDI